MSALSLIKFYHHYVLVTPKLLPILRVICYRLALFKLPVLEAALPACPLKKTKGALKPSETPDANDIELRANALAGQVPASLEQRMEPRARSREATMTHL